jgi:hypothetical protein
MHMKKPKQAASYQGTSSDVPQKAQMFSALAAVVRNDRPQRLKPPFFAFLRHR